jgi:O-antigen ligase
MRNLRSIIRMALPSLTVVLLTFASLQVPPTAAFTALFLALTLTMVLILRISAAELLVATMPITFYADIGGRVNLSASDLLLVLVVVRIVTDPSIREYGVRLHSFHTFIWVCAAFLFAVMTIGVILSSTSGQNVAWPAYLQDGVKLLIVLVYFSAAYVVFAYQLSRKDFRFLQIWTYAAVTVSILGIAGVFLYGRGLDLGLTMSFRARSTFEDPNAYATYLLSSTGIIMAWSYLKRGRILTWHVVPVLVGAYVAYSRAAIVASIAVLALGFVLSLGHRQLRALRYVAYSSFVLVAFAIARGDLEQLLEPRRDFSFEGDVRFSLWGAAINAWKDSPIFGAGLGQFRAATSEYIDSSSALLAHNTYLSFLAEGGVLGVVLFFAIPSAVVLALLRRRDTVSRLILLSVGVFLAMAVTLNLQNFRPMWVVFGIALAWCAEPIVSLGLGVKDGKTEYLRGHLVIAPLPAGSSGVDLGRHRIER